MHFLKNTAKSFIFFLIIISVTSLIYTSILYFSNKSISTTNLNLISFFISILIFFILGIYISLLYKEKGLMNAFIVSLTLLLLIILFKLITKTLISSYFIKALCNLFAASIGGIIGINLKKR